MAKMKPYSFLITDDLADALKAVKDQDGTSESETIRSALRDFFKRRARREADRQIVNLDDAPQNREWLKQSARQKARSARKRKTQ
jgi:Arc/MetJ-type ribon-helix-helix transcriptional regulator